MAYSPTPVRTGNPMPQRGLYPLESTAEMGYLESSRILQNPQYSQLVSEVQCCICQNVLWRPVACSVCENAFCAGCIRTWTEQQNPSRQVICPFNCKYQEKRAPPILNNLLSKLQIYCAYRSNGCKEFFPYDGLEKHEEKCKHERTPCRICGTPVSYRDQNNTHDLKQCFQQMYEKNPDQIQAQFMKLLDIEEPSQQRIQALENLLGVKTPKHYQYRK